ncbi:hypothetical protein VTJ04DRAFT_9156 [Mycothermus thermophilus]|uniref:uncharacterized protein n=1 Tax=Humicola insolens TaxID=85995 RepID=UPI00374345BF
MRASLYTLCLGGHILNFIIKVLSTREASAKFEQSYRDALSVQGTALLCTAWYQSIQNRLTLFHAVVIFHLLGLLGVNLASHISSKGASKFQDFVNKLLAYFAAFFYIAFNMYVWIRDPDFGSQPECNETVVYVLFGQSVKATYDAFRYLILGNTCLIAAFTLAYFLAELILCCCCPCWRWLGMSRANRAKSPVNNDDDNQREPLPYLGDDNAVAELGPDQWGRAIMVVMSYTGFSIYAIVSLEQIISRNQRRGDSFI